MEDGGCEDITRKPSIGRQDDLPKPAKEKKPYTARAPSIDGGPPAAAAASGQQHPAAHPPPPPPPPPAPGPSSRTLMTAPLPDAPQTEAATAATAPAYQTYPPGASGLDTLFPRLPAEPGPAVGTPPPAVPPSFPGDAAGLPAALLPSTATANSAGAQLPPLSSGRRPSRTNQLPGPGPGFKATPGHHRHVPSTGASSVFDDSDDDSEEQDLARRSARMYPRIAPVPAAAVASPGSATTTTPSRATSGAAAASQPPLPPAAAATAADGGALQLLLLQQFQLQLLQQQQQLMAQQQGLVPPGQAAAAPSLGPPGLAPAHALLLQSTPPLGSWAGLSTATSASDAAAAAAAAAAAVSAAHPGAAAAALLPLFGSHGSTASLASAVPSQQQPPRPQQQEQPQRLLHEQYVQQWSEVQPGGAGGTVALPAPGAATAAAAPPPAAPAAAGSAAGSSLVEAAAGRAAAAVGAAGWGLSAGQRGAVVADAPGGTAPAAGPRVSAFAAVQEPPLGAANRRPSGPGPDAPAPVAALSPAGTMRGPAAALPPRAVPAQQPSQQQQQEVGFAATADPAAALAAAQLLSQQLLPATASLASLLQPPSPPPQLADATGGGGGAVTGAGAGAAAAGGGVAAAAATVASPAAAEGQPAVADGQSAGDKRGATAAVGSAAAVLPSADQVDENLRDNLDAVAIFDEPEEDDEDGDDAEDEEPPPRWYLRPAVLALLGSLAAGAALLVVGLILHTRFSSQLASAAEAFRWCYFFAAMPLLYYGLSYASRHAFSLIEWWFFRESLLYLLNVQRSATWLLFFLALLPWYWTVFRWAWCESTATLPRRCQQPAYVQATQIVWNVLLCLMLFCLANLLKAVLAKLLTTHFYRTAHFKKLKSALEKEYALQVLSKPRRQILAERAAAAGQQVGWGGGGGGEGGHHGAWYHLASFLQSQHHQNHNHQQQSQLQGQGQPGGGGAAAAEPAGPLPSAIPEASEEEGMEEAAQRVRQQPGARPAAAASGGVSAGGGGGTAGGGADADPYGAGSSISFAVGSPPRPPQDPPPPPPPSSSVPSTPIAASAGSASAGVTLAAPLSPAELPPGSPSPTALTRPATTNSPQTPPQPGLQQPQPQLQPPSQPGLQQLRQQQQQQQPAAYTVGATASSGGGTTQPPLPLAPPPPHATRTPQPPQRPQPGSTAGTAAAEPGGGGGGGGGGWAAELMGGLGALLTRRDSHGSRTSKVSAVRRAGTAALGESAAARVRKGSEALTQAMVTVAPPGNARTAQKGLQHLSDGELEKVRTAIVIKTQSALISKYTDRSDEDMAKELGRVRRFAKALFFNVLPPDSGRDFLIQSDLVLFFEAAAVTGGAAAAAADAADGRKATGQPQQQQPLAALSGPSVARQQQGGPYGKVGGAASASLPRESRGAVGRMSMTVTADPARAARLRARQRAAEAAAAAAFTVFDADNNGEVSRSEVRDAVVHIYKERRNMARSLKDTETIVQSLEFGIGGVIHFLFAAVYLLIWGVDLLTGFSTFSATVLALTFVFGNSVKNMYESMLFLFVTHPYDVGDCVVLGTEMYRVKKISLLYTDMVKSNGERVYMPNTSLITQPIINWTRSKTKSESCRLVCDIGVAWEVREDIQAALRAYAREHAGEFEGEPSCNFRELVDPLKVVLTCSWNYAFPPDDFPRLSPARNGMLFIVQSKAWEHRLHHTTFTDSPPGS